jgi:hypothetical protein
VRGAPADRREITHDRGSGNRGPGLSVMRSTNRRGIIVQIDILADPERLRQLELAGLGD